MSVTNSSCTEASVPAGVLFIAFGVSVWFLHYSIGIFTNWAWAALVGNLWVIVGALLLFSDVRVYQFDRSPVEQLVSEHEE